MNEELLKRWVGLTGITLPIFLIIMERGIPVSFSATYYGAGHDVFISALAVIGGALGAFRRFDPATGKNDPRDTRAATIASVGAFGVGFFPMAPDGAVGWIEAQGWLHFVCALAFFGALASMCGRLFPLSDRAIPGAQKLRRNAVYRACAVTIVVGVAALAVVAIAFERGPAVFWIESVMTWAFGLAFVVKSGWWLADTQAVTLPS